MLAPTPAPRPSRFTALRFAWRDLRGGVRGFAVFVACIALGVAASVAVGPALAAYLYGVAPADPLTMTATVVVISAVALLASYIPARRATKVDPMVALRYEQPKRHPADDRL